MWRRFDPKVTRRSFVSGAWFVMGGATYVAFRMLRGTSASPPNAIDAANDLFRRGEYASARSAFLKLAATGEISSAETAHAAALCSLELNDPKKACEYLCTLPGPSVEDWRVMAFANARAGHIRDAIIAFQHIPSEDSASDLQLLEEIALAAAQAGDKPNSWRFYREIEQTDPGGSSMQRLNDSGRFGFTTDFFGYDRHSLLNYARGLKDGAVDWTNDTVKGIWH